MDGSPSSKPEGSPAPPPRPRRVLRRRNQGIEPQSWLMETLEWQGFRLLMGLTAPLGSLGRGRLIARLAGWLGPLSRFTRRIDENIDLVRPHYDEPIRRRIRRGVMANFARTVIEYVDLPALAARASDFKVSGLEHLEAARKANGGRMVMVSAHYGNWEAVRAVAALHGEPVGIIYRAFNNKKFDDYSFGRMTACGWPAFRKGAEGSKELFKHLRGGGAAMILVDQRLGGAPTLDFMGAPAETSLAAAQLALRLDAPLLPAAAKRVGDGFEVWFEPPIPPSDPLAMSAEVNRIIGNWVDAAPEQWFWLHRRWRQRERGDSLRTYGREAPTDEDSDL